MSILLDSLRKSEAQRKVGDTPTIYSTQEYGDSAAARNKWLLWLLLGLTAIAIVWFGWQQYSFPGAAAPVVQVPVEQVPDSATTEPPPMVDSRQGDSAIPAPVRTPVEQLQQAADSAGPSASEPAGDGEADTITALERIADYVAENEPSAVAETEQQVLIEPVDSGDNTELTLAEERPEEDISVDSSASDRPLRPRMSQTDPPEDEPLSYWQLEQGLRNNLPEFKITVLVYAEAPEDRFLLMNGERLREQDEFEGVTLEEIRRDGAVFSYQSYRFLVKN